MWRSLRISLAAATTLSLTLPALADREAHLKIGDPSKGGRVTIAAINSWGGWIDYCTVTIPDPCDARRKAQLIKENCAEYTIDWNGDDKLRIGNLRDEVDRINFYPGDTEEGIDKAGIEILTQEEKEGSIGFTGRFQPYDHLGQPAYFTAGIVTDVGELTARVSAQELNFQTDGPIICQALFQRLAPRAPQFGAIINYSGERLDVRFDPAATTQTAYVVFGTTSPSEGCFGSIRLPPPAGDGDMNCDGDVNAADIEGFTLALFDPDGYAQRYPSCSMRRADMNGDGQVNSSDIEGFIDALFGP